MTRSRSTSDLASVGPLRLRPTLLSDLDFVQSVEDDPANRPFITPWARTQHEGAVRFPDFRHFIVEGPGQVLGAGGRDGFIILQGCRNPHGSVELKRLVLHSGAQGQGLGRRCVRRLKQMAFADLGAHRFWLDVKLQNTRGLALYVDEGFVEEGRLRDSVRLGPVDGVARYDSLVVMSLLQPEYTARVAAGLEVQREVQA